MATPRTTSASPTLPAVIDLGRRIAALSSELERQEQALLDARGNVSAEQTARNATEILDEQRRVLQELVTTIPARSMADAAVQIAEAFLLAEDLHANIHPAADVERLAGALTRLLLSALPVVAAGAGLDPVAMGWDQEVGSLHASRFAGLDGVS